MVTFVGSFVSEEARQWNATKDAEEARIKALHPESEAVQKEKLDEWTKAHPAPKVSIAQVADHIDHIRSIAGIEHIGIGSDFDGFEMTPVGLEGVEGYPALFAELIRRGYGDDEIRAIAGRNLLRVWRKAEAVAVKLQQERKASDVLIEDVDTPVNKVSATAHE
jgi:membrane dipeptidase